MHQMQSLKNRMAQAVSDDEQTHSVPEKGILKKTYGSVVPMDGGEDSTSDNQEVLSQSDNLLSSEQVEHKIRSLDGYTRSMLEALHTARNMQHQGHSSSGGNNTPSGTGSSLLTEEILRRSLESSGYPAYPSKRTSSQEKICDEGLGMMPSMVEVPYPHANYQYSYGGHGGLGTHSGTHSHDEDDDGPPPGSRPMTIRNLTERVGYSGEFRFPAPSHQSEPCHANGLHWHSGQDIIRQIDTVGRHISPSGSDDIQERMYHEGSESSRRGSRGREDMSFVLGRFRPSANRHGSGGSAGSSHYGHPYPGHAMHHQLPDEESIYETADPDRAGAQICGDTPDSESDDCVQARRAMAARSPSADRAGGASDKKVFVAEAAIVAATTAVTKSPGAGGGKREYYPSPPSSSSDTADSISPSERTQLVQRSPGATSAAVAVSSTTPPHKLHNGVNGVNGSGLDGSAVGVGVGSASSSTESEDGAWAASSDSRPHGAPSTSPSPGPGLGQSQKKRYPEYKH